MPKTTKSAVALKGSIDETTDLAKLIGPVGARLTLNVRELRRINSSGIRAWTQLFEDFRKRGVEIQVEECSTALVPPASMIDGFLHADEVVSIQVPFFCTKCQKEFVDIQNVQSLRQASFQVGPKPCPVCKTSSGMDEIPTEYFKFLRLVKN